MSKHIPATPTLEGDDAERLLEDLKKTCSPEEMDQRVESAKMRFALSALFGGSQGVPRGYIGVIYGRPRRLSPLRLFFESKQSGEKTPDVDEDLPDPQSLLHHPAFR